MEVALDGTDADLTGSLDAVGGQQGLQQSRAHIHGPGRDQHVGHEDLVVLKLLAHHGHTGHEALGEDVVGRDALVDALLHQRGHGLGVALLQARGNVVENAHGVYPPFVT